MGFEDTVKRIEDMLKSNLADKTFGRDEKKGFMDALSLMKFDIQSLTKEEKVSDDPKRLSAIHNAVNILFNHAVYQPHTDFFRAFCFEFLKITFNWNKGICNKSIQRLIDATDRMMRAQLTLAESHSVLRKLTDRLKKYSGYEPPAFELSKHYLKSLLERDESKGE